jgi:lipid II:glycine glycyltransferase (peptidoglycan interpeptide bridge formation enzyme)
MPDIKSIENFIQTNSPDGGFLQSEEWRKFQESFGRKTFHIEGVDYWANIIEHSLPIAGRYFYIPRGPIMDTRNLPASTQRGEQPTTHNFLKEIINLAQKENINWIRFDADNLNILDIISKNFRVKKAPHDMQPRELLIINITKPEEELLVGMKSKTRYNIKVAQKHNVKISISQKYLDEFIKLVKITARRDKITPHPDEYYRKMFKTIPEENLKLYLAEFEGKIITANIVIFYGKVATYLHGASDNDYRNVMAPYLLQWQAILDAKAAGCEKYDLGGVKTCNMQHKTFSKDSWEGITRFKTGFSTATKPIEFPGSYDIVLNPLKYNLYRILQRIKALF